MKKLYEISTFVKEEAAKHHVNTLEVLLSLLYCRNFLVTDEFLHLKAIGKLHKKEGYVWVKDPVSKKPVSNKDIKNTAKKNVICLIEYGFIK